MPRLSRKMPGEERESTAPQRGAKQQQAGRQAGRYTKPGMRGNGAHEPFTPLPTSLVRRWPTETSDKPNGNGDQ